MDSLEIFKALSNKTRLQILQWLKEPENHFQVKGHADFAKLGVCVGSIETSLSQSTVSEIFHELYQAEGRIIRGDKARAMDLL